MADTESPSTNGTKNSDESSTTDTPAHPIKKTEEAERFLTGWITGNQLTMEDICLMKAKMDEVFAQQCGYIQQTKCTKVTDCEIAVAPPVELEETLALTNGSKELITETTSIADTVELKETLALTNGSKLSKDLEVEAIPIADTDKLTSETAAETLMDNSNVKIPARELNNICTEQNQSESSKAYHAWRIEIIKNDEKITKHSTSQWADALTKPMDVNEIHSTFQEIFETYFYYEDVSDPDERQIIKELRDSIDTHMLQSHAPDLQFSKMQAYFKLSYMCKDFTITTPMVELKEMLAIYGLVHSNTDYYKQFDRSNQLLLPCIDHVKSKLSNVDTISHKLLPYILDSILRILELTGHKSSESRQLWSMISLRLESYIEGVRYRLLNIFAYIIDDQEFLANNILVDVLTELTWLNPTKYELLAVIFKKYTYDELLTLGTKCGQHLKPEVFFKCIVGALKHDSLAEVSQKLMVAFCKSRTPVQPHFTLSLVDILQTGSMEELEHLEKYWAFVVGCFGVYNKLDIADASPEAILQSDEFQYLRDDNFQKLVLFRLLFHQELTTRKNVQALDAFIVQKCIKADQVIIIHTLDEFTSHKCLQAQHKRDLRALKVWLKNIYDGVEVATSLLYLVKFIQKMVDEDCTAFIEREVYNMLLFLLPHTEVNSGLRELQAVNAILDIESIFLDGIYNSKCEARLQLLLVFLDLFENVYWHDKAVYKVLKHPKKENKKLQNVLFCVLNKLLMSENKNVRALVMKITKKHLTVPSTRHLYSIVGQEMEFEARCNEYNTEQHDIHYVTCSDQFAGLCIEEKLRSGRSFLMHGPMFSQIQVAKIDQLYWRFKADPFAVVMGGHHYFGHVNALQKFFEIQNENYEIGMIASAMQDQLDNSTFNDTFIELLNVVNPYGTENNKDGPSQRIMDLNIHQIIRKSKFTDYSSKNSMQFFNSIMESIKSFCKLNASLAIYYLKFTNNVQLITVQVSTCLTHHFNVLSRCPHPETNRFVGESLGPVVRLLTELSSTCSPTNKRLYGGAMKFLKNMLIDRGAGVAKLMKAENSDGMCEMFYQICKNDRTTDEIILSHCLFYVLPDVPMKSMPKVTKIEITILQSYKSKQPVHFKQLTRLIQDPDMAERMCEFLSQCWKLVFETFKSANMPDQAVLDLYDAVCVRLTHKTTAPSHQNNQKATNIALDDVFTKYPSIWQYIVENAGKQQVLDKKILDFLSQFEYRSICSDHPQGKPKGKAPKVHGNQQYRDIQQRIADKRWYDDQIDRLLRKFAIQLEKIEDLGEIIQKKVISLFGKKAKNNKNLLEVYSIAQAMSRFESNVPNREIYLEKLRAATKKSYTGCHSKLSYSTRLEMVKLLLGLGFSGRDAVIWDLIGSASINAEETKKKID